MAHSVLLRTQGMRIQGRLGFFSMVLLYAALVLGCLYSLVSQGDISWGRQPWVNLLNTAQDLARPSFMDLWWGDTKLEYRSDDGRLLRTENRQIVEQKYLVGLAYATWITISIATLGSLLGALLALPLAVMSARNLSAPRALRWGAQGLLGVLRSVHTLVFGLVLVGIVGLGPTAGILAIALHSTGTYGKLFAESIEALDMAAIEAVRSVGASPSQVFFNAVWPAVLPQWVSSHLYVWEFNIRDSTILGLIGAGGLGLLITEATSLFQWGRLSTVLLVVIVLVVSFDTISGKIRKALL